MSDSKKNILAVLGEKIGLNWIPILFNDAKFQKYPRPSLERHNEIKTETHKLDLDALQIIVPKFEKLLNDDDKRRLEIDSKASTLIGFTGIAIGIIVGFSPFLLEISTIRPFLRIIMVVIYFVIGASLIFSVIFAHRAMEIGKESYMAPDPSDLLKIGEKIQRVVYRELAADLLRSYEHNLAIINDKAIYAKVAQIWFRNAIFSLFFLMCSFVISPIFTVQNPSEPVRIIILTPSPFVSTATPTSVSTSTPNITPIFLSPTSTTTIPTIQSSVTVTTTISITNTLTP